MSTEENASGKFYLWHLANINLVGKVDKPSPPPEWTGGLPEIKVAIIDSGCATGHPNLPKSAITPALDLAVNPKGAVYSQTNADAIAAAWKTIGERLRKLGVSEIPPDIGLLIEDMAASSPEVFDVADPAEQFAAHGTACAGLVAGRTLKDAAAKARGMSYDDKVVLNYFGVNPFATIIPVATGYNHEIEPVTRALLHAIGMGADVILLPRSVYHWSKEAGVGGKSNLRRTRFDDPESPLKAEQETFEKLIGLLAPLLPIVLAAGNDGLGVIAYPASLVDKGDAFADLIVAGAANSNGRRSSYSSGLSTAGVAVFAPSDDEERIDANGAWFNPDDDLGKQMSQLGLGNIRHYSPYGVLALDVPGRLGGPDLGDKRPMQLRDLYTIFGGTSAASAIVAGLASLVAATRRKKDETLTGKAFRDLLRAQQQPAAASRTTPAPPPTSAPRDDSVSIVDAAKLLGRG